MSDLSKFFLFIYVSNVFLTFCSSLSVPCFKNNENDCLHKKIYQKIHKNLQRYKRDSSSLPAGSFVPSDSDMDGAAIIMNNNQAGTDNNGGTTGYGNSFAMLNSYQKPQYSYPVQPYSAIQDISGGYYQQQQQQKQPQKQQYQNQNPPAIHHHTKEIIHHHSSMSKPKSPMMVQVQPNRKSALLFASILGGIKGGALIGAVLGLTKILSFGIPIFAFLIGLLALVKSVLGLSSKAILLPGILNTLSNGGLLPTTATTTIAPITLPTNPTQTTQPPNTGLPIITTLPPILTTLLPTLLPLPYNQQYGQHHFNTGYLAPWAQHFSPYDKIYYKKK